MWQHTGEKKNGGARLNRKKVSLKVVKKVGLDNLLILCKFTC